MTTDSIIYLLRGSNPPSEMFIKYDIAFHVNMFPLMSVKIVDRFRYIEKCIVSNLNETPTYHCST